MQKLAEHIVTGYDDDLNQLTTALAELGGLVETMTANSVRCIKKRDSELAQNVIAMDKQTKCIMQSSANSSPT